MGLLGREDLHDRAARVVADERDVAQVEAFEDLDDEADDRDRRDLEVVGHREAVRAERQHGNDAAVIRRELLDDGSPEGLVHEQPVEEHDRRSGPAGVEVLDLAGRRREPRERGASHADAPKRCRRRKASSTATVSSRSDPKPA